MIKRVKWNTRLFERDKEVNICRIELKENEPWALISTHQTDYNISRFLVDINYGEVLKVETKEFFVHIHAETLFSSEETDKLRIRVRAREKIEASEIEEFLKQELKEIKHLHRGTMKGKKFGL